LIAWAYPERTLVRPLDQEDEEVLPDIGMGELIILLAIILLLFGARRVPEIARALGASTREFRKGISQGATEGEDRKHEDNEKPPLDEADEVP
jgi:sec-independent protein translocase protein TatA